MQPADPDTDHRSWTDSPLRRVLIFLGITWSIAAALLALQEAEVQLTTAIINRGWGPEQGAPSQSPTAMPVDCRPSIAQAGRSAHGELLTRESSPRLWKLGFDYGLAADLANIGQQVNSARMMHEASSLADSLGINPPNLPVLSHELDSIHEFGAFVGTDQDCVSAQIEARFSSKHAALYKLAVFTSYSAAVRVQIPTVAPLFVPEIRYYGGLAGIPKEVWQPFIADSIDALPGGSPKEKIIQALNRVGEYVTLHPE